VKRILFKTNVSIDELYEIIYESMLLMGMSSRTSSDMFHTAMKHADIILPIILAGARLMETEKVSIKYVSNDRELLEKLAQSMGIEITDKTTDTELAKLVSTSINDAESGIKPSSKNDPAYR